MGSKGRKKLRYCFDALRSKMFFETEEEAKKFIEWNAEDMYNSTGYRPVRTYYCQSCQGWHVTKHGNESFFRERNDMNAKVAEAAVEQGGRNTGYFNTSKKVNKRYLNKSYQDLLHSIRKNGTWKAKNKNKKKYGKRDGWKEDGHL